MSTTACCCSCTISLSGHVADCSGITSLAGVTVTVYAHGTSTVLAGPSAATTSSGNYSLSFTGSAPVATDLLFNFGGATKTLSNVTLNCGSNSHSTFLTYKKVTIDPFWCSGLPVGSATITITGPGGSPVWNLMTDPYGGSVISFTITVNATGTYTVAITAPRFNAFSTSFTVTSLDCGTQAPSLGMTQASGYGCMCLADSSVGGGNLSRGWPGIVPYPVPLTLFGSWSGGGTFSGTLDAVSGSFTGALFSGTFSNCTGGVGGTVTEDAQVILCAEPGPGTFASGLDFTAGNIITQPACPSGSAGDLAGAQGGPNPCTSLPDGCVLTPSYTLAEATSVSVSAAPPFALTAVWDFLYYGGSPCATLVCAWGGTLTMSE